MEKKAISMQRSMEGMPIFMSGVWIFWEGLMAPAEVRKEIRSFGGGLAGGWKRGGEMGRGGLLFARMRGR